VAVTLSTEAPVHCSDTMRGLGTRSLESPLSLPYPFPSLSLFSPQKRDELYHPLSVSPFGDTQKKKQRCAFWELSYCVGSMKTRKGRSVYLYRRLCLFFFRLLLAAALWLVYASTSLLSATSPLALRWLLPRPVIVSRKSFAGILNSSFPRRPLIVDLHRATHFDCFGWALHLLQEGQASVSKGLVRFPFASWNVFFCSAQPSACVCGEDEKVASSARCSPSPPLDAFVCRDALDKAPPPSLLVCGGSECSVSRSALLAAEGDALVLYHTSLSHPLALGAVGRQQLLWPKERRTHTQLWALVSMWESTVYNPGGADGATLRAFNLTIGSDRRLDAFLMSYLPDWGAMLRPFSLADKMARAALPRGSNVTLIQSNCGALSGRDDFYSSLLVLLPVDSFGQCLNNRDAGAFARREDNFEGTLASKMQLLYGYKFVLCFENSYAADYVTEKFFDALEAHAVPVYRGAPNIADYAPGERSFIHVTEDTTPEMLARLLTYLDGNDTAYNEYHAWRSAVPEDIRLHSPLGRTVALSAQVDALGNPLCAVCKALHNTSFSAA
jgi:hypothetical protein